MLADCQSVCPGVEWLDEGCVGSGAFGKEAMVVRYTAWAKKVRVLASNSFSISSWVIKGDEGSVRL